MNFIADLQTGETRVSMIAWSLWQEQIVDLIHQHYSELIPDVAQDDIDWEAWRPLYDQGQSPLAAVRTAFSPMMNFAECAI